MKINSNKLLCFLSIICIIYASDSFISFANVNDNIRRFFQLLVLLLVLCYVMVNRKFNKSVLYIWMLLLCCFGGTCIWNGELSNLIVVKFLFLTFGFAYASNVPFEAFKDYFVKIMSVICVFSLMVYILQFMLGLGFFDRFPIISNISGSKVYFCGISNVASDDTSLPRSFGPFWEPGVYAIYLSIAMMFKIGKDNKIDLKTIMLALGIISTLSTTGISILGLLIIELLLGDTIENKKYKIVMLLVLISTVAFMFYSSVYLSFFGKFDQNSFEYVSTLSRIGSFVINIDIWLESPLFGVGSGTFEDLFQRFSLQHGFVTSLGWRVGSNTNGLFQHFSMFGLIVGCVYLVGYYYLARSCSESKRTRLIYFIILLISLFAEPFVTSLLFEVLLIYGFIEKYKSSFYMNKIIK